jgi:hypothetical protein
VPSSPAASSCARSASVACVAAHTRTFATACGTPPSESLGRARPPLPPAAGAAAAVDDAADAVEAAAPPPAAAPLPAAPSPAVAACSSRLLRLWLSVPGAEPSAGNRSAILMSPCDWTRQWGKRHRVAHAMQQQKQYPCVTASCKLGSMHPARLHAGHMDTRHQLPTDHAVDRGSGKLHGPGWRHGAQRLVSGRRLQLRQGAKNAAAAASVLAQPRALQATQVAPHAWS